MFEGEMHFERLEVCLCHYEGRQREPIGCDTSSLYFPEADKQTSSTGQLWYTAWCPLLQVRRGGSGEGNGGKGRE